MIKRPTLKNFCTKALKDPSVNAEYDALSPAFEMKWQMIAMRKEAGLTQEKMADLLGTKKSNISTSHVFSNGSLRVQTGSSA